MNYEFPTQVIQNIKKRYDEDKIQQMTLPTSCELPLNYIQPIDTTTLIRSNLTAIQNLKMPLYPQRPIT